MFKNRLSTIQGDLAGGLASAIVALPLAIAFGVASGAGPSAGIYGAILVGFFASLFGGTAIQISGPTGPMTVIFTAVILLFQKTTPEAGITLAFTVVVIAGLFQISFGLFKLGKYISLVPYPVLSGVMTAVGLLIIITELPPLMGVQLEHRSTTDVLLSMPKLLNELNPAALGLGFLSFALVAFFPKRWSVYIPSPLIAVILGTLIVKFYGQEAHLEIIGEIPRTLPTFHWPIFKWDLLADMIKYGFILALLGSIDSLLTSLIADNKTRKPHHSDQELMGQGIGNMISGCFGGLPGAGATMRTLVNIKAGGQTKASGMIHSSLLLLIVLMLAPLTQAIPHAVLAGILTHVGLSIIDWEFLKSSHRLPWPKIVLMASVVLIAVFVDLISSVFFGVVLTSLMIVKKLSEFQIGVQTLDNKELEPTELSEHEKNLLDQLGSQVILFDLDGPLIFSASQYFKKNIIAAPGSQIIMIDFTNVGLIDLTMAMVLKEFIEDSHKEKQTVLLIGLNDKNKKLLSTFKFFNHFSERHTFKTRSLGIKCAMKLLHSPENKQGFLETPN